MANQYIGFGNETAWGTYVAPTSFLEIISESLRTERNFDDIETFRSFSLRDKVILNSLVRGDMEILANYEGMTFLFKYLLGSADITNAATDYTHTFPASTGIPSTDRVGLSLSVTTRRDDSLYWKYAGMKPLTMQHAMAVDAASRMTVGWLGKAETTDTTGSTATYPTLRPMSPQHITVNLSGSAVNCESVTVNVENPVDELFLLGNTGLGAEPVRNGVLKVTWSADLIFENFTAFYDYFDGTTSIDTQIQAVNGTYTLTYNMDACRIIQATPAVSGRDRLRATVEGESIFASTAAENFQVILENTDTTSEP